MNYRETVQGWIDDERKKIVLLVPEGTRHFDYETGEEVTKRLVEGIEQTIAMYQGILLDLDRKGGE